MKPTMPRRVKGISPRVSHGLVPYQYQFCESIRRCWTRNQRNVSSHGVDAGVQYGQDGGHGQGPQGVSVGLMTVAAFLIRAVLLLVRPFTLSMQLKVFIFH